MAEPALQIMTVTGLMPLDAFGVTDAHNHVWIEPVQGAEPGSFVLNDQAPIQAELADYRAAGGSAIVDCQPGGCGRNGQKLIELSRASGVLLVACTGFYLRHSYAPSYWLWHMSAEEIARAFLSELDDGLEETRGRSEVARAGFVKAACVATLAETPQAALEGAAAAVATSGAALEIHTEKGADAEAILRFFVARGVQPRQIVICHMDKRPDFGLHRELAQAGALLEYDTFYRPVYNPETALWPLIERMVGAGLERSVALATDMAPASMWKRLGGLPCLTGMLTLIRPRLQALGYTQITIDRLTGGNVARRLAGLA